MDLTEFMAVDALRFCRAQHLAGGVGILPAEGARLADVVAIYEHSRMVIEVSAKRTVSPKEFRRHVRQAVKQAEELAEDDVGGVVYAPVINRAAIEREPVMFQVLRAFLPIKPEQGDIRLVALRESDFVALMKTLGGPRGR